VNDCPDTEFPGGLSALQPYEQASYCLAQHAEHTLRRRRSRPWTKNLLEEHS